MNNKFTAFRSPSWASSSTKYGDDCVEENIGIRANMVTYNIENKQVELESVLLEWADDEAMPVRVRTTIYTLIGKRCIDVIASLFVILFILSWLTPIIALLIYIDSPGPFYFRQQRTGHRGKSFFCLKFRTMLHNSTKTGFQQTAKNDARVTRLGSFLRRTNLDEMLQFINVLIGDMTLVGPRPHAVPHDAVHWASDSYRARYLVKPGITGLAQIKGARGATTHFRLMEHRVRYDHFYINRQDFLLDTKICIDTIKLSLQGDSNAW